MHIETRCDYLFCIHLQTADCLNQQVEELLNTAESFHGGIIKRANIRQKRPH